MGGANFMGRDSRSLKQTDGQKAFDIFVYWLLGGGVICFGVASLIFKEINPVPIVIYIIGVIGLWIRYVKAEKGSEF